MSSCFGCKHVGTSIDDYPCKYCSVLYRAYEIIDRFEPEEEGEKDA